ncbi:hypothetical protein [Nocardia colli]|uniref:hypothetical protein n=1 Tax=Nocardia colli TaxID=2545717 RepID=UPI0035D8629B
MAGNARKPAVSVVIAYLAQSLGVPVSDRVPANRPESYVLVRRVGGVRINEVTDGPWILCECVAPATAEVLAMRVADLLEAAPGEYVTYLRDDMTTAQAWIASYVEVGAPAQNPDEDLQPDYDRWTLTAQLGISSHI